jgi:hypothetical protein
MPISQNDSRRPSLIEPVERNGEFLEELRTVGGRALTDIVERSDRRSLRVGLGLQHQRGHGADKDDLGDTLRAMTADVTRHLAAAG